MKVAFNETRITPKDYLDKPLAGYSRKDHCLGKLDDIHAYGVLINVNSGIINRHLLLISVDILKLPLSIVEYIKMRLILKFKQLKPYEIVLHATHTHSSFDLTGEFYYQGGTLGFMKGVMFADNKNDRFIVWMTDRIIKMVSKLIEDLIINDSNLKDWEDIISMFRKLALFYKTNKKIQLKAESILNQSFLLSKKINDSAMLDDTLYYQAVYEWFRGNLDKGIKKAKENLDFVQKHKFLRSYAYTANLLSSLYQQKKDLRQAHKYLEKAIEVFKATKRINALASALINQAVFYHWEGNFSKAKNLYENSLILAQQTENRTAQCESLFNLGSISYDTGKFDEAIEFHKKALEISPGEVTPNYSLSMIYYKKGDIDKAKSILEKAIIKEKSPLYYIALTLINLALGKKEDGEKTLLKGFDIKKIGN